jgi:hypothetical protein
VNLEIEKYEGELRTLRIKVESLQEQVLRYKNFLYKNHDLGPHLKELEETIETLKKEGNEKWNKKQLELGNPLYR